MQGVTYTGQRGVGSLKLGTHPVRRHAGGFDIDAWFAPYVGDYWLAHDLTRAWPNSDATGVVTDGEVVGAWRGQRDTYTVTQGSYGAKFIYSDAEKAMELSDSRMLEGGPGIDYRLTGEPASIFIFARRDNSANGGAGELLVKTYDTAYYYGNQHLAPFDTFYGSPQYAHYYEAGPGYRGFDSMGEDPDCTVYRGVSHVYGPVAHRGPYNNDYPTPAANTSGWADTASPDDSGYLRFLAPGIPPRLYYVKMILLIRKALTLEDRTNLLAYARALP